MALTVAGCDQQTGAAGQMDADMPLSTVETAASGEAASSAPEADASSTASSAEPRSCAAEIGKQAAGRRADLCRTLSPATHPPCNAANSCAMIEDEIARSCALLDEDDAPPADCRPDPKSKAAAIDVVKRYYAALDAKDYDTAWRQWGGDGPPNQTQETFRAGFAHTRTTRVTIGAAGDAEGAAGSIYLTVPVTVEATLDSGAPQRFRGEYILRRVNDVDGATADQLRWHIDSARLQPQPRA
ncbi:hypothetical protein [Sphingopyxis sp. NJF-3]